MTSLGLTRKFQTVWLGLHFWWRLRLQLGYVSSWGSMASSISYAFWSLWFFLFNRGKKQKFKYVCPLLIWNISWGPQDSGNWPPVLTTLPPFSFSVSSWRLLAEGIYGNSLVHFEELLSFSGCHLCTQEVYMLYFQFFFC